MKKTQQAALYPLNKGLDKVSIPGSQDPRSLSKISNGIINTRGSLKKAPGVRRLSYTGKEPGNLQGAVHFFATSGGAQVQEIVRVINGRVEALRNGNFEDLGVTDIHPTDTVTFSRFANTLIMSFENTPPKQYTIGGSVSALSILSGHDVGPPIFSVSHDFRNWYGGRGPSPHIMTASAINQIEEYSLSQGGLSIRIPGGEGDPKGLTGCSRTFRGDIFPMKWNSVHRIYRTNYGYGVDQVTDEVGCVHHNTIVATQNDIYFCSTDAIHSLANTDKYGAVEESTITAPIYEYFQDNVNWGQARKMIATYDKPSNCYMLSFASRGSSIPDKVLAFNVKSGEFYEWDAIEYPVLTKYYDSGRQKTLVGDEENGLGVLDTAESTRFGENFNFSFKTGVIFPLKNPKAQCTFTKAWLIMRPTLNSVISTFKYYVDGDLIETKDIDTEGGGATFEGTAGGIIGQGIIGSMLIGRNKTEICTREIELSGTGGSIEFELTHTPAVSATDQFVEAYGIVYEFEYNEDTDQDVNI